MAIEQSLERLTGMVEGDPDKESAAIHLNNVIFAGIWELRNRIDELGGYHDDV